MMRIVLGGVRGTSPVSHSDFLRYGGATTSLLVDDGKRTRGVIDAGTGLHALQPHLAAADADSPPLFLFTHYHLDHAFGNSEFVKLGAVVIAQENDKKSMEKSAVDTLKNIGEYGLTQQDMKGTKPAYPALAYGDRMTIDIGGQQIELIHARYSHTTGDTLVYLPDKKVLFAGGCFRCMRYRRTVAAARCSTDITSGSITSSRLWRGRVSGR